MALVGHFGLGTTGTWVKVDQMIGGEIWSKDFMDDGIGVLCCDVYQTLVILIVAYIVKKVEICDALV
jgi:hypothetical protein